MEIEKRFIAKIRGYHVMETRYVEGCETVEVFYTIRNKAGFAVGKSFDNPSEPIDLLLNMQKSMEQENS